MQHSHNWIIFDPNLLWVAQTIFKLRNYENNDKQSDVCHSWAEIYSLEPPLAVLALISNPSSVTDAGSVDTFSRETILVTRFRRGGVSEQYKVKQHIDHQVSVDPPQVAVGGYFGSEKKEFSLTFPPRIHFCFARSTKPSQRPGPLRSALGGSLGYSGCFNYNKEVLHIRWVLCILTWRLSWACLQSFGGKWLRKCSVS